jgi:hypothetical protein
MVPQSSGGKATRGPVKDIAIPIVFPHYRVLIEEINARFPLGHAGILFINGGIGTTKYYEYGRYDKERRA